MHVEFLKYSARGPRIVASLPSGLWLRRTVLDLGRNPWACNLCQHLLGGISGVVGSGEVRLRLNRKSIIVASLADTALMETILPVRTVAPRPIAKSHGDLRFVVTSFRPMSATRVSESMRFLPAAFTEQVQLAGLGAPSLTSG